jgi:hypothetical protein
MVWRKLGLAVVFGIVIGAGCAVIGNLLGINGALLGGVAGGVTAGLVATMMREKPKP